MDISIKNIIKKNSTQRDLLNYNELLDLINKREEEFQQKSISELKKYAENLKHKSEIVSPDNILIIKAFALVREVFVRLLKMRPFDVQIIAAIVLFEGKLAEMKTGEGKTLVAVFPAFLSALNGNRVHILTFNDYLAKRDANWMRPVYEFFDLTVGYIREGMNKEDRKKAYNCDILYATAKEIGFDYLRSFIAYDQSELIQKPFNYVIVDEADALLIDEARNPLILAGNIISGSIDLDKVSSFVSNFQIDKEFLHDEYSRNIYLSDSGIAKAENHFKVENLHSEDNIDLLSAINLAIHAKSLLKKDIDYIIKEGKVRLIDEFTGRIVEDRKWQNGLQSAVEAKEKLKIQTEATILGSITIQHLMALYPKLTGMTATAKQAAEEFEGFYNLQIVRIPSNKSNNRIDYPDLVFSHKQAKVKAIIDEVNLTHKLGRPILIGTLTVKESEEIALKLNENNIDCKVLNAKNDELEAEIISQAGTMGAVTISTNMAGRGTDILIGGKNGKNRDELIKLGGLHVIGTNRHESVRIDNQLRGRAARQGDPGSSKFIISLEDDLMLKYKLKELLPKKYRKIEKPILIDRIIVKNRIIQAQRIIEGQMYDLRQTLFEYTDFIEKHRQIFQAQRQDIFNSNDFKLNLDKHFTDKEKTKIKEYLLNKHDSLWASHLEYTKDLQESIHLVRLGGEVPIRVFHKKADDHFKLINNQVHEIIKKLSSKNLDLDRLGIKKPSSSWTYIVNDNPYGNNLGISLISNIGFQIDLVTAPILMIIGLIKRIRQKTTNK